MTFALSYRLKRGTVMVISDPQSGTHGGTTTPSDPGNVDRAPFIDTGAPAGFVPPTVDDKLPSGGLGGWDSSGAGDPRLLA